MVWLAGTISIAWTALNALDPGASTLAPTATAVTAITATMAAGKTMPNRRIRPRLRRLLRAPVRCRDKAILSSGYARQAAVSVNLGLSAAGLRSISPRRQSAAPDLVRRLSPRASTAGGQQCQKPAHARGTSARNPSWRPGAYGMNAAFMSSQQHESGIHALRSGAHGTGVTCVRFYKAPRGVTFVSELPKT